MTIKCYKKPKKKVEYPDAASFISRNSKLLKQQQRKTVVKRFENVGSLVIKSPVCHINIKNKTHFKLIR